jgi:hypothetical protein
LSKYLLYECVVFVDRRLLLAALADVGYTEVEEGEALPLYGYEGDRRPETAELLVRRRHLGRLSNDLGFRCADRGYVPGHQRLRPGRVAGRAFPARAAHRVCRARGGDRAETAARQHPPRNRGQPGQAAGPVLTVPEAEFIIDTATGERSMQVHRVAGPTCDDVAKLVNELAGQPDREQTTAEYNLRPRVRAQADSRVRARHR